MACRNFLNNDGVTYILDGLWGWHSRWEHLRARIENTIGPCRIWHYDNSGRTPIKSAGAELRNELLRADAPLNLIGYSMGGLVIREALRSAPEISVRRAAFLHCPHGGTLAACFFPLPACREMRPGSDFLARLNEAPWTIPTLVTWCAWDLMVVPGSSARWTRASASVQSHVPAHAWPTISPGIHQAVIRFFK